MCTTMNSDSPGLDKSASGKMMVSDGKKIKTNSAPAAKNQILALSREFAVACGD
jgi:hypothetical protein